MRRNIEIKARVANLATLVRRVRSIADEGPTIIDQEDTFFHSPRGRLKLRKFSESKGELIYYDRPDLVEPAECRYLRSMTSTPDELLHILSSSLGVRGIVRKRRTLYCVGHTRIHLDAVEALGQYVELEVVLSPDQDAAYGVRVAQDLIEKLGIAKTELVDKAYIDLLDENPCTF
ncbi:MAG: class IV adenylate cyclase [Candidatus Latescibacterota bacterium]|nr:MAG: class IV adenylate cyclase [Candidatus Latescibacterota bacterium]